MKKTTYITPAIFITKISVENMIAYSGPETLSTSAAQDAGMDVKVATQSNSYSVWDDDWSE